MNCTIVVPCYNEAARLQTSLYREYLGRTLDVQIIFVNDGSSDSTLALLRQLEGEFPDRIEVLDQQPNAGKGEAVRKGILHGLGGEPAAVGFWDADLAAPLEAVHDLMGPLGADPEIQMVFGARVQLMGRHVERKPSRHYLGRVFATTVSLLLSLPIYDTQCGAKLFRANEETRRMFADPFLSRWVFDVELLARFIQDRNSRKDQIEKSIYEFPLYAWRDVAGSKVGLKDFFRAFWDLIKIGRKYR